MAKVRKPQYILFVCGHNAGRSQMGQAFFNHDKENFPEVDVRYEAISVGTRPGEKVNPQVIAVMREIGLDLSDPQTYFPKGMDSKYIKDKAYGISRVIVACDDTCVLPPEVNAIPERWNLPDPHGQPTEKVREARELTRQKVGSLLLELLKGLQK